MFCRLLKAISTVLFTLSLLSCSSGNDNGPIDTDIVIEETGGVILPSDWVKVWSDEFDSNSLDLDIWEVQLGDGSAYGLYRWGNDELQNYSEDNLTVEDGFLRITAAQDSPGSYSSGRIRTQNKKEILYGRIEARIKVPSSEGLWPAFWMLGNDDGPYGTWPSRGEIDIMEYFDRTQPHYAQGALHFGMPSQNGLIFKKYFFPSIPSSINPDSTACASKDVSTNICLVADVNVDPDGFDCLEFALPNQDGEAGECIDQIDRCLEQGVCPRQDPTDDFHVYSVEWNEEEIHWFIDGNHYFTVPAETYWTYGDSGLLNGGFTAGSEDAPFDAVQHIILNLAVGGNLPKQDLSPTFIQDEMLVDYVRVYECSKDPLTGLGCEGGKVEGETDDSSIYTISPYHQFEFYSPNQKPFISRYILFADGEESLFSGASSRFITIDNDNSSYEIIDAGDDRGNVLAIDSTGTGSVGIKDVKGEDTFHLVGMGRPEDPNYGGELKFDLYIDEADSDFSIDVYMTSGSAGTTRSNVTSISAVDLASQTWQSLSVPLEGLLDNSGTEDSGTEDSGTEDSGIVVEDVSSLIRFSTTGNVKFQLDNIQLVCGSATGCRIQAEAAVEQQIFGSAPDSNDIARFESDSILSELWDKKVVAWDTITGQDYSTRTGKHVSWLTRDIDLDLEVEDYVLDISFGDTGAKGVVYIGSSEPVDLSGYALGSLVFDIRVLANESNAAINMKVDHCVPDELDPTAACVKGGTGEMPIPAVLSPGPNAVWETVKIPVCSLTGLGLIDSAIVSPLVIVPGDGGRAQNVRIQLDNIYFDYKPTAGCDVGLPIDFEKEDFLYPFKNFEGGSTSVISNEFADADNSSNNIAKMVKYTPLNPGKNFGGSYISLTRPLNFDEGKVISITALSQVSNLNFGLKLESSSGAQALQPNVVIDEAFTWKTFEFDFTGAVSNSQNFNRITIIIDSENPGTGDENSTLYFDNLTLSESEFTAFDWLPNVTLIDYDDSSLTYAIGGWGGSAGEVSTDPDDPTNNVGKHTRFFEGSGAITSFLSGPILGGNGGFETAIPLITDIPNLTDGKTSVCIDLYSPTDTVTELGQPRDDVSVSLKLEDGANYLQSAVPDNDNVTISNTGWQRRVFHFSNALSGALIDDPVFNSANGDGTFEKITLNFEGENFPSGLSYYWDNVEIIGDENNDESIDVNDCGIE